MDEARPNRLTKLEQQRQKLQAAIRREKLKLEGTERKKDTRRKILVGATMLTEAEKDPSLKERIQYRLNATLQRDDDRALFGLKPLSSAAAGEEDQAKAKTAP